MTIKDVGDGLIYLGAVAAALAAIAIVMRVTAVRPLQRWIREYVLGVLTESRTTARETKAATDGMAGQLDRLSDDLRELRGLVTTHLQDRHQHV